MNTDNRGPYLSVRAPQKVTIGLVFRARNKNLKVGRQLTAQNQLWPVTLVILAVTIYGTRNVQFLMFEESEKNIKFD